MTARGLSPPAAVDASHRRPPPAARPDRLLGSDAGRDRDGRGAEIVACWQRDARAQGLSLEEFARTVIKPRLTSPEYKTVRVVAPNGTIYITDAHHTVWALLQLERATGVELSVKLRVEKRYDGCSQAAFAHDFLDVRKKGQFPQPWRRLPAERRMQLLPTSFADLRDNPLRSAVGRVFYLASIRSSYVEDYAEFEIGAELMKAGLLDSLKLHGVIDGQATTIPSDLADDPRVIKLTHDKLFGEPELLSVLHRTIRANRALEAKAAIERATGALAA